MKVSKILLRIFLWLTKNPTRFRLRSPLLFLNIVYEFSTQPLKVISKITVRNIIFERISTASYIPNMRLIIFRSHADEWLLVLYSAVQQTNLLPRLFVVSKMASRVILSHAKFLGYVAFNELNFVRSSVSFGYRCVRNASYVNFSKKLTRNNDSREITASTSLVQNGVRSFSLQHWHGESGTYND